ncbi:MAG: ABC transporter ATP-binding protein/permease [Myxococcales bacterium]|nr:ABC transporter ATP-binding protein/permease [Myxococcales bacterium]
MFDSVRAVWHLMQGSRALYGAAIAALVVASCFLYLAPLIPQAVIDGVLMPPDDQEPGFWVTAPLAAMGGPSFVSRHLWVPALVVLGLTAVAGAATYLRGRWAAQASEAIVRRLRDRVYDHMQHLPSRFFDTAQTGDLLQRCTSDVETIRVFLANQVVEIGRALIMFFVPLPLMIQIDARMTGVAVLLLPFIVGFSVIFFLRVRTVFEQADEAEGEMTTTIQENLTGIRVVRAFGRQAFEEGRFAERNADHRGKDYRLYQLMAVFWSISDLMTFAQHVLVVGAGVMWVSTGELSVGALFYFLTAVSMFMYPLRQMGRIVADLGKATVALGRLRRILDEPAEQAPVPLVPLSSSTGALALAGVTFRYAEGAEPALKDLTLRIEPRSTVAFVGASGSGKSTLVSLLLRLYDPDEGSVTLDGRDLRTIEQQELRRQLAVVMQQPFLYSKTLGANLKLGRSEATLEDVHHAARTADVHETIVAFDDGYDTEVGERGVTLSGGQRQRVALARALLQRPSVLILDDSLSAVDTATESAILERLRERRGQQTTILIAHRLSTVALADRIFVLDEGRLVQQGTHDELVARAGPYRRMWRLQTEPHAPSPLAEPPDRDARPERAVQEAR